MISANELRIGNWLWYDDDMYSDRRGKIKDNWFQVAYIGETIGLDIGFEATQRFEKNPIWSPKIKELKPIQLTPELLVAFGWEKTDYEGREQWLSPWLTRVHRNTEYRVGIINEPVYGFTYDVIDGVRTTVNYLHQLQNLYFALTGTELNYTPEK